MSVVSKPRKTIFLFKTSILKPMLAMRTVLEDACMNKRKTYEE